MKYARLFALILLVFLYSTPVYSQFLDEFENEIEHWFFFTGDGKAEMDFIQMSNFARIIVDASNDQHNVWWAIIKCNVSSFLEIEKLADPDYELRVEAKVRVSHAPRRINFMLNTQRTTNFHEHLKEYDIPVVDKWHTISMTTQDFDVLVGDSVYVQLGVTDWGLGKYYVDLDYYKADIVNVNTNEPDLGEPLTYHPEIPDISFFSNKLPVGHDGLINLTFPNVNLNNYSVLEDEEKINVLSIDENQWAILRWDFSDFNYEKVESAGVFELTTYSILKGGNYRAVYGDDLGMEFGKVRIIEILGGDSEWNQESVTYSQLVQDQPFEKVFNSQMIFDIEVSEEKGAKNYITISRPVMQRMFDGITKGLLIKPLGAINAVFYSSENKDSDKIPKLYFNLVD